VNGATELRIFNPNEVAVTARVDLAQGKSRGAKAIPVDFESHPVGKPLALSKLVLKPKQIMTLRIE
jgi:hypothetical protein